MNGLCNNFDKRTRSWNLSYALLHVQLRGAALTEITAHLGKWMFGWFAGQQCSTAVLRAVHLNLSGSTVTDMPYVNCVRSVCLICSIVRNQE